MKKVYEKILQIHQNESDDEENDNGIGEFRALHRAEMRGKASRTACRPPSRTCLMRDRA